MMGDAPEFLEGKREGACLYGTDGRRFIDGVCGAGAYNLGRRHPDLAEALREAMHATDQGNFPMISAEKAALAEDLARFVGGGLECAVYSVTRGEAMEVACKVARGVTRRKRLLAVQGAWHGDTGFALSLSHRDPGAPDFGPLIPEVDTIAFGDIDAANRSIRRDTAAVFLEPVQAENHCRTASADYVQALARRCKQMGALFVLDETQTNFGRTGVPFAFRELGVAPDMLILGEALGGGMFPIAATLLTQRVNRFLNKHPMIHLSTFGGSDIGCRVAQRALALYENLAPWDNAARQGEVLVDGIRELVKNHPGSVAGWAGQGLLLSLDLETAARARAFCAAAAQHGLLVLPGRVAPHTVLLRPSLLLSDAETREILVALEAVCQAVIPEDAEA
ncbi:MAG: aminotransferase class III-fold pyridoxal phosphate-dependent enzyme [Candidatus Hydrogenedentota bacterium]